MRRAGDGRMKSKLIVWVAQGFGIGRIPFAPGTWGSVLGIVWALLLLWPRSLSSFFVGTVIAAGFAVWCCGRAERILGQHDPGSVVLDEIVALPLTLGGAVLWAWIQTGTVPSASALLHAWPVWGVGFGLFRLFDIWKPWPVGALQRLPGGWGVVADDLAAGVLSGGLLALACQVTGAGRLLPG